MRASSVGYSGQTGGNGPGSIFALTNFARQAAKKFRNCSSVTLAVFSITTVECSSAQSRVVHQGLGLPRVRSSVPCCVPLASPSGRPRCFRMIAKGVIMYCSTNVRIVEV